jgi:hypothetical protein
MHKKFGDSYETAECHGYSNGVEKQAPLQAKVTSGEDAIEIILIE